MSSKYKPNYDETAIQDESDRPNLSGLSARENVSIEETAQRRVAESEAWLIAREFKGHGNLDAETFLTSLGFTDIEVADDLFFSVCPPPNWTKTTEGYWTEVFDETGTRRLSQFYKGAWYDREAFFNVMKTKSEE